MQNQKKMNNEMTPGVFVNLSESLLLTIKQISEEAEIKIQNGAASILLKFMEDCDYNLADYIDTLAELFHTWIRDTGSVSEDDDRNHKSFNVQYLQNLLVELLNNRRFVLDDMHFSINKLLKSKELN